MMHPLVLSQSLVLCQFDNVFILCIFAKNGYGKIQSNINAGRAQRIGKTY